jgi:hypothetical protein
MSEEEYLDLKDEKELRDSQMKENMNSLEIQENEELFSGEEQPNIVTTKKIEKDNKSLNDYIFGEKEDKYIALIEGLENELLIEQYITKSLKKDLSFNEEVNKLKSELNSKNIKLEKLKSINKKQENTLLEFKNKLKKEIKKGMNNKVIINNENNISLSIKNINEVSKNEAVNNGIKAKDSALVNIVNKMNILRKENEELKKKIYQNENNYYCFHVSNSNSEEYSQKNNEKIKFLQNEIKLLNKQLIEHNRCIEEQNKVNKEYNNLKNELRNLKINNQDIKNKIKDFEKKILNIEINDINNNNSLMINNNLTIKRNNLNLNITNKRQSSVKNPTFSLTTPKTQKENILPIISIQPILPNSYNYLNNQNNGNKSILNEEFTRKIKKYFGNNDKDFYILIKKINDIERGNNTDDNNINYYKLKKYNTQCGNLDKLKIMNYDGKDSTENMKMMQYKLETLNDEYNLQNKKIEELKKNLDKIKNVGKEKDNEIMKLRNEITSMKNALKSNDKK